MLTSVTANGLQLLFRRERNYQSKYGASGRPEDQPNVRALSLSYRSSSGDVLMRTHATVHPLSAGRGRKGLEEGQAVIFDARLILSLSHVPSVTTKSPRTPCHALLSRTRSLSASRHYIPLLRLLSSSLPASMLFFSFPLKSSTLRFFSRGLANAKPASTISLRVVGALPVRSFVCALCNYRNVRERKEAVWRVKVKDCSVAVAVGCGCGVALR